MGRESVFRSLLDQPRKKQSFAWATSLARNTYTNQLLAFTPAVI
jgi:hypothetical protein